jgi:hypothetical protein
MDGERVLGPNLKKLIILKMNRDAIPPGGGLAAGIEFLTTHGSLSSGWEKAAKWCDLAIQIIREAPKPNPWKMASEEEIAGELLRQIDSKKAAARSRQLVYERQ